MRPRTTSISRLRNPFLVELVSMSACPVVPSDARVTVAENDASKRSLEGIVKARHSCRAFLSTPIDRDTIYEALRLASFSPSNSNTQPWRCYLADGDKASALKDDLVQAAQNDTSPAIPPCPPRFNHFRAALGKQIYSDALNLAQDDFEGRRAATIENFRYFGAPTVGCITLHHDFDYVDAVSVGLWLQTFLLALTERGLGTITLISVTGYPSVLRQHLSIPDDERLLCGIAIGHADNSSPLNGIRPVHDPLENNVFFRM